MSYFSWWNWWIITIGIRRTTNPICLTWINNGIIRSRIEIWNLNTIIWCWWFIIKIIFFFWWRIFVFFSQIWKSWTSLWTIVYYSTISTKTTIIFSQIWSWRTWRYKSNEFTFCKKLNIWTKRNSSIDWKIF